MFLIVSPLNCLSVNNTSTTPATMLTTETEAVADHGRLRGIMGRYRSKYALIFPLLALSGLMFLLRNILTLEVSVAPVI